MKKTSLKIRLYHCAITLVPFIILFILTKVFFREVYLLEWLARHWYWGLWSVASVIAIFNFKLSLFISSSNVLAAILGQTIGDAIRNYNIAQITPDMTAELQAHLHLHYGFHIWLISILVLVTMFFLYGYIRKRKNK